MGKILAFMIRIMDLGITTQKLEQRKVARDAVRTKQVGEGMELCLRLPSRSRGVLQDNS